MNGLLAHGPTRVLTGLLIIAILSMAVVASPANAQSDAEDLYDDGSTLPLSTHGEALLGFVGARLGGASPPRSVLRTLLWGALAMAVTAGAGHLFGAAI